eukprot:gene28477-50336_t
MTPTSPIRHLSPPAAFTLVAWSLLALWVFAWLAGPVLLSMAGLAPNPHGYAAHYAHGEPVRVGIAGAVAADPPN